MEMKPDVKEKTIDWNRSIDIDESINDDLVRKLAPRILQLRQESDLPITVGINSPGGSLASLDNLLGLLVGPTQNSKRGQIITVATNRAYSAAASFLAFGTYAVAFKHSEILYHDVRWAGMEDVTPAKARYAAKQLQDANDTFALKLAHQVIRRLVWVYLDLGPKFKETTQKIPKRYERYANLVDSFAPSNEGEHNVDVASFAASLFYMLSRTNEGLIENVMSSLARWITMTKMASVVPSYRTKGSRNAGMLDGMAHLHRLLSNNKAELPFSNSEKDLNLFLVILVNALSDRKSTDNSSFTEILDKTLRDFTLIQSIDDKKHQASVQRIMTQHKSMFLGKEVFKQIEGKTEEEQSKLIQALVPRARLFWHFCVLLCRELLEGEHILSPADAQLLGLVDEVAGGGPVECRREFGIRRDAEPKASK